MAMNSVTNFADRPRKFDPYRMFISNVPNMVEQARYAAETQAFSYRDFKVGAAIFAMQPETEEVAVLMSGNLKSKKHKTKICAEKKALDTAKKRGFTQVVGLVVAGTTDVELIEEVTGLATPTLHPCDVCRNLFVDHPLMRPESLVFTVGLEEDVYQVHSQQELHNFYEFGAPAMPTGSIVADFNDWSKRKMMYDFLTSAEEQLPILEQRTPDMLAAMALRAA